MIVGSCLCYGRRRSCCRIGSLRHRIDPCLTVCTTDSDHRGREDIPGGVCRASVRALWRKRSVSSRPMRGFERRLRGRMEETWLIWDADLPFWQLKGSWKRCWKSSSMGGSREEFGLTALAQKKIIDRSLSLFCSIPLHSILLCLCFN